jgi:hypothetical protein
MSPVTDNDNMLEGYWKVAVYFLYNGCVTGRFERRIKMKNVGKGKVFPLQA